MSKDKILLTPPDTRLCLGKCESGTEVLPGNENDFETEYFVKPLSAGPEGYCKVEYIRGVLLAFVQFVSLTPLLQSGH